MKAFCLLLPEIFKKKMAESRTNELQLQFLNRIREMIPENHAFVDELSDVMNLSTDSIYRRLRGETALSIDEVALLCRHYKISFDTFAHPNAQVNFQYHLLKNPLDFKLYLQDIRDDMQRIASAPNKQIVYAAIDIPIFHHFAYPELGAFKMFYWLKAIVNLPQLEDSKFDPKVVNEEMATLGKEIYELYCQIPSVEIWTADTVNSLVKQIEFFWESGNFQKNEDAILICEQAIEELNHIERQAAISSKKVNGESSEASRYLLYESDIEIGNNCILTQKSEELAVYLSVHTFNKMLTRHPSFCADTQLWLDNLTRKSVLISGSAEKNRYRFFKTANTKLKRLLDKIFEEGM